MPSKKNRHPGDYQDLHLRQRRVRRALLAARRRRIRELEAANRYLREQLRFLQQLLEEDPQSSESETIQDETQQDNNNSL